MNRLKQLALTLLVAHGCACGGMAADGAAESESGTRLLYVENGELVFGPVEQGIEIEPVEPTGDIGQASQPLLFPRNGAGNPGIKPDTYQSCVQGDHNQNCVIPDEADLTWFLYDGTASQKLAVRAQMNAAWLELQNGGLAGQCKPTGVGCWKFREATDLSDPELNVVIALSVNASGSCPGSADQTRSLLCWSGSTTGVAKDGATGLYGTYHRFADHIVPVATIDMAQLMASSLTAAQKTNRIGQLTRALIQGFAGKGFAIIGDNRCNNTFLLDPNVMCSLRPSDVCWMGNFGDKDDSLVWRNTVECAN